MADDVRGTRVLWIVSGAGSSGKTSFLRSQRCLEVTGVPADTPVIWPDQAPFEVRRSEPRDVLLHYSLFQLHRAYNKTLRKAARKKHQIIGPIPFPTFDDEPNWNSIATAKIPRRAIVIVASEQTIIQRVHSRELSEIEGFRESEDRPYNTEKLIDRVQRINLLSLYQEWLAALRQHDVPYILVSSEDESYPIIAERDLVTLLESDPARCGRVANREPVAVPD